MLGGEISKFGLEIKIKRDSGARKEDVQIIQRISIQSISNARIKSNHYIGRHLGTIQETEIRSEKWYRYFLDYSLPRIFHNAYKSHNFVGAGFLLLPSPSPPTPSRFQVQLLFHLFKLFLTIIPSCPFIIV